MMSSTAVNSLLLALCVVSALLTTASCRHVDLHHRSYSNNKDVELANSLDDDLRSRVDLIERVLSSMIATDILQSNKDFATDVVSDYIKLPDKRGRSYIGRRSEDAILLPVKPSALGRRARGERVYIGKRTVPE